MIRYSSYNSLCNTFAIILRQIQSTHDLFSSYGFLCNTFAIILRQIQRSNDMFFPHIIFFHNILNKDLENTESMCIYLNALKAKKSSNRLLNVCRLQRLKPNVPFEYYLVLWLWAIQLLCIRPRIIQCLFVIEAYLRALAMPHSKQ